MDEQSTAKTQGAPVGRQPLWSSTPATFRGVTPVVTDIGRLGVYLNGEGGQVFRYSLGVEDARRLAGSLGEMLADYERRRTQSETSSGIPSVEGSTPDDGKAE